MIEHNLKMYWIRLLFMLCLSPLLAQDIYIGNGGSFNLKPALDFVAGSNPVTHHLNGVFTEEAGVLWTDSATYVDGKITVYDAGTTTVNIGDTVQSLMNITTVATDEIVCDYTNSAPSGNISAALSGYELSDVEYWTVNKITGASTDVAVSVNAMVGATYNGNPPAGTEVLVRYNTINLQWEQYSGSLGFGDFTFAADQSSLGVDEVVVTNNFKLYPNPVSSNEISIYYDLPNNVSQLSIMICDLTGKEVYQKENITVETGVNQVSTSQLAKGMYFIQFSFNNKAQVIIKKLLVK